MYKGIIWIIIAAAFLVSCAAAAIVDSSLSYQGKLTDASGNPLTGSYSVTFSIYDTASGGTALWTDTHTVTAANGVFTTTVAADPTKITGQSLWLGVRAGSDPEMTPRQGIRPVPIALTVRPGAVISATDVNTKGLSTLLTGTGSTGFSTIVIGQSSTGVKSLAFARDSTGIDVTTIGENSNAINATTAESESHGVYSRTSGDWSKGVYAETSGAHSSGVEALTNGAESFGVVSFTRGGGSHGVFSKTYGDQSVGIYAVAEGADSKGAAIETWGSGSTGLTVWSSQGDGIWIDTGKADGKYAITTGDYINAHGYDTNSGDVAEFMPVTGDVEPGTVLVIGPDGKLRPCNAAYDTRVAGIVSTEPGVSLATKEGGNAGEEIIALAGRVPCKVDASYGAIHAGDLLSTSATPGHAMKAVDPKIGTVLGKAMGTLESGTGTIEVLVTLQ